MIEHLLTVVSQITCIQNRPRCI